MSDENEQQGGGLRISTLCHDCGGDGVKVVPTLMVFNGQAATKMAPRPCPTCSDNPRQGRLRGIVPPV
ncbi:hypothetical protein [Qaidamihabitans albus]|uniref:hypothetical protein n=1 Tax=Qaidamihabitans albus TaxID=2795733 RepID=UPI0018F23276|nr:hypothetical protein [Qaidamihabitans albus]